MTAKQFRQKAKAIFKEYKIESNQFLESQKAEKITTKFGELNISIEWVPKINVASIHSNFFGNKFHDYKQKQKEIREITGYNFSSTLKNNFYFSDPQYCLIVFEEYLKDIISKFKHITS